MRTDFDPKTWQACWEMVVDDQPAAKVAQKLQRQRRRFGLCRQVPCAGPTASRVGRVDGLTGCKRSFRGLRIFRARFWRSCAYSECGLTDRPDLERSMQQPAKCPSLLKLQQLHEGCVPFSHVEALAIHLEQCETCVRNFQAIPGDDTLVGILRGKASFPGHADTAIENLMVKLRKLKAPSPP